MTLEALCAPTSDVLIYDTFNAAACAASAGSLLFGNAPAVALPAPVEVSVAATPEHAAEAEGENRVQQGRRKRRRRQRSIKNRDDAESQRMAHIAIERNRRRLMNEYLAVLRSLMPESYVHRGDQASIVSGAIDFVKELEQQLQSLEAQKLALQLQRNTAPERDTARAAARTPMSSGCSPDPKSNRAAEEDEDARAAAPPPFARFFRYPQYVWRQTPPREDGAGGAEETSRASGVADVEVSVVVDAHASLRVMAARRPGQLLKMLAGMQALGLAVLHLNVTTALDALALYTLSLKVEEGCSLTTADDIATAVHHVLCIIDAEATAQRMLPACSGQPDL
ncbi:transcription factor bHLH96-like isoform X2 [Phragmites australis]|uniref:transcription factor bHLH96-like isoform X2 n=1 Tax=Phragmites australis TaxID=29695 RepID=UPI002D77A031|nr:transcription factor bHLH96-like isoform X2 [Phragmites australis]